MKYQWLLGILFILAGIPEIHAQNVEVEITGIRSKEGQVIIEVYTDCDSFREEQPCQRKSFPKNGITNGTMIVELTLGEGTYGLALIDDENDNGDMDFRKIGLTKEGFAFSDFYLEGLKRPVFDDFSFAVEKGENRRVNMKIRYM